MNDDRPQRTGRGVARAAKSLAARAATWLRPGLEHARIRAETLDLSAPEVTANPFPYYDALRASGPVHYLPRDGTWIVLGHDEVKSALQQPRLFSSRDLEYVDPVLLAADPPRHTAIRLALSRHFAAPALGAVEAHIDADARALIGPAFDVVGEYAAPLARHAAARFFALGDDAVDALESARTHQAEDTAPQPPEAIRRASLYRALVHDTAGKFDERRGWSLMRLLWGAGTDTAQQVIARGMLMLLERPDLRAALERDTALIPRFAEEVMRLHPPGHTLVRTTTQPVVLGGVSIPAEARVRLSLGAANRDPRCFQEPNAVRFDRSARQSLAFGGGAHRCIGIALGRRVTAAGLGALVRQAPPLRALHPLAETVYRTVYRIDIPERLVIGS